MPVVFLCLAAVAIDGDTLRCRDQGLVRLARIDAPEMPHHCRPGRRCAAGDGQAAKAALAGMLVGPVRCTPVRATPSSPRGQFRDRYGRIVARCGVGGRDLGKSMLKSGHAVRWP